jgi:DNA uptake protein ComE-like DNA-binding protein
MQNNWKDYFSFTRKERIGIIMLVLLIGICTAAPYFFSCVTGPDKAAVEAFNAQKAQLERSGRATAIPKSYGENYAQKTAYHKAHADRQVALFTFDPNTLNDEGWKKLGLNNRTIHTIQNYVAHGGRFHKPTDLQKVYGLKPEDYNRLLPYVQITSAESQKTSFDFSQKPKEKYAKAPPAAIDVNLADTSAFIALPGIGSKLANRIINFRDKLGGFYSVDQVAETYGLPDSTFQLIKPRLQCEAVTIRKININTADAATLKQHPYIRWNIANAIVQFRQQHGAYHSPQDLQQIAIITPELFEKVVRYVSVE